MLKFGTYPKPSSPTQRPGAGEPDSLPPCITRLKDGIAKGIFNDGPRMKRLDVLFANRYLAALESRQNGQPLTRSWKVALDAHF